MIKVLILVYCYSLRQNNTSSPYRATKYLDHVTSSFTPYIIYTLHSTYIIQHRAQQHQLPIVIHKANFLVRKKSHPSSSPIYFEIGYQVSHPNSGVWLFRDTCLNRFSFKDMDLKNKIINYQLLDVQ